MSRRRLRLAIGLVAAAGCLWGTPVAAQALLAASGVVSDTCADVAQTSCSSGTVYVVDATTLAVRSSLRLWRGLPNAGMGTLVVDRKGIFLYAAGSQTLSGTTSRWIDVVNLRTMTRVATFGVSGSLIAASPDGSRLYLLAPGAVAVIDGATGAAIASIPSPDAFDVVASPAGDRLFIARREVHGASILVVDAVTHLPLDTITLADPVSQLALTDDGTHLYALTTRRVLDIDTASRTVAGAITYFGGPAFLNRLAVAGGRIFVTASGESPGIGALEGVAAIDVATRAFITLYPVVDPFLVGASSDGSRVWVQTFGERSLNTFDTASNTRLGFVTVPGGPVTFAAIPASPPARVVVDDPVAGAAVRQPFTISGWAADATTFGPGPGVSTVHVWAFPAGGGTPSFLGADYGRPRPDVGAFLGPTFTNSGFAVPVRGLQPGAYRLAAYGFSLATGQFSIVGDAAVTIEPASQLVVDTPSAAGRVSGRFTIAGWALDPAVTVGTGIDAVHVWAYPEAGGPVFAGAATIGDARPDVGAYFGTQFERAGFHLEVAALVPGAYTLVAYGHSSMTGTFSVERQLRVSVNAPEPRMWVDTPVANAMIGTTFAVSGWAVEANVATGTGVDVVHVWATSPSGAATFLGAATYGRSRPDIAGWLGPPFEPSGFALTATLPAGVYTISVYARSTTTGTFRQWQAVQVTVR